jgi:glycosyltransferase involved in cell wall biosynthesis
LKNNSISIFFPAYNDAKTIGGLVRDSFEALPKLTDDHEVIVINDGSRDDTAAILDGLSKKYDKLRVIHHPWNMGYGAALKTGFGNATKDLIFYTDGDGQYDVKEISKLVPLIADDIDVVNGYKLNREDDRRRIILGYIYNFLAQILFRLPIRDVDCDFRLIRRKAFEKIKLESHSGFICVEMVHKMRKSGCRFAEAPVTHYLREHGSSQFFTIGRVLRTACDFIIFWVKLVLLPRVFGR